MLVLSQVCKQAEGSFNLFRFERCSVGDHRTVLSWKNNQSRPDGSRPAPFYGRLYFGSFALGCSGATCPSEFGKLNSVFKRFRRLVKPDAFYLMFKTLAASPDFEYAMIDEAIVKVYRAGQGAKGSQCKAIGKPCGGVATKTLARTVAIVNLADFCLLPGQAHDLWGASEFLEGLEVGHILADRGFDADWQREALSELEIAPVIPPRKKTESRPQDTMKGCANGGTSSRTSARKSKITEVS